VRWDVLDPHDQGLDAAREVADTLDALVRDLLAELEVPVHDQTRPLAHAATG
jgi:hypothetical protein